MHVKDLLQTMRTGRRGERLFVALFGAAYVLLVIDLSTSSALRQTIVTIGLGAVYILAGIVGFALVERGRNYGAVLAYFAVMLPFGAMFFLQSVAGGTLFLLAVVAQSVRVLPPWGVLLLCLPLPLLHVGMAWPDVLREGSLFLAALVFVVALSRAIVNEQRARAELDAANRQLRMYAAQAEELATTRERNRLAREIHDGLGHYLTTITMQLQAARTVLDSDRPRAVATLLKAQKLAQEALGDVRLSVAAMRAVPTERDSLPRVLAALIEESRAAGISADLSVMGETRPLGPQAEQTLYRAAQEGLTNVRKHAHATRTNLRLDYCDPRIVRLEVYDDGQGAADTSGGFGLLGLRERAQLLGGAFHIVTAPGQGLHLTVEVPG